MCSSLSIVIPVINEEQHLTNLLADIDGQRDIRADVVVVDGGSTDESISIAQRMGARVRCAPRGRATQMNAGTRRAEQELLLFLHADSRLPDPRLLDRAIRDWQSKASNLGHRRLAGHFQLRFRNSEAGSRRWIYRFLEAKSALNRPYTFNGDQGLLIHRSFLRSLGGFDESLPFLEDQRIGGQIHRLGDWITLDGTVSTSTRRFDEEGFWPRYIMMGLMVAAMAAEADEFFASLPQLYQIQSEASDLKLRDFAAPLVSLGCDLESTRISQIAAAVARCISDNAWQLPFLARLFFFGSRSGAPGVNGVQ